MKASKSKAKKAAPKASTAAAPRKAAKHSKPKAKPTKGKTPTKAPKAAKAKPVKSKVAAPPKPKVAAVPKPKVAAAPKPKVAAAPKPKVVAPAKAVKAEPKPVRRAPPRADYGAPIDDFLAKQPPELRAILTALRELVDEAAPHAHASLKWGQPFYTLNGAMMCALGAHQAHVNLILVGAPDAFVDPEGRLSGQGSGSRHLKLTSLDDFPRARIRQWLAVSAAYASKRG